MITPSITVEQRPSTSLAVVRRQVRPSELSRAVPEGCGSVWSELRAQDVRGGRNVAIYWDDSIQLEAGVEVLAPFVERAGIVRSATPAGLVAALRHLGPYGTLSAAHQALHDWCRLNRHSPVGPRWEIYGHWQEAWNKDPSRIDTEVAYLVRPT
jgi:effector-binding domain-containing protein